MRNGKTAEIINEELRVMQQKWFDTLPPKYKATEKGLSHSVSSPFCCGISQNDWESEKKLIMFVGEEPRNWWFNYEDHHHEGDIGYLQGYSIAYFEKQVYSLSREINGHDYFAEYQKESKNPFGRKNTSMFWAFIKRLSEKYAICWTNVDKLHKIKNDKTILLNKEEEGDLHNNLINGKTLLLNEIAVVKPDYIIFLGKAYENSIKGGLMIQSEFENSPELEKGKTVVEINTSIAKKTLWMCHPAALNRSGKKLYEPTIKKIFELLKEN